MIDLSGLNEFSKRKSKTFHQEKKYIKQILNGSNVSCRECLQPLTMRNINNNAQLQLQCKKGCTDILLDVDDIA